MYPPAKCGLQLFLRQMIPNQCGESSFRQTADSPLILPRGYSQILDCNKLTVYGGGKFECEISVKTQFLGNDSRLILFSDATTAQNFNFN